MPIARTPRALAIVSGALLAYWALAAVIAVTQDWPAEFGTSAQDDPETAWEWIRRGSLLHAPLPPVAAQIVFTVLVLVRRHTWRAVGSVGLALLGVVYLIGFLGEPPLHPERSDPPVAVYLLLRLVLLAGVVTMLGLAVASSVRLLRRRGGAA